MTVLGYNPLPTLERDVRYGVDPDALGPVRQPGWSWAWGDSAGAVGEGGHQLVIAAA